MEDRSQLGEKSVACHLRTKQRLEAVDSGCDTRHVDDQAMSYCSCIGSLGGDACYSLAQVQS